MVRQERQSLLEILQFAIWNFNFYMTVIISELRIECSINTEKPEAKYMILILSMLRYFWTHWSDFLKLSKLEHFGSLTARSLGEIRTKIGPQFPL